MRKLALVTGYVILGGFAIAMVMGLVQAASMTPGTATDGHSVDTLRDELAEVKDRLQATEGKLVQVTKERDSLAEDFTRAGNVAQRATSGETAANECLSGMGRVPVASECVPGHTAPLFIEDDGGIRVDCDATLVWCDDEGA